MWPDAVGRALGGEVVADQVVESIRSPAAAPERRRETFAFGMNLVGSAMAELSGDEAGAEQAWRGARAFAIHLDLPVPERFRAQGPAPVAMPSLVAYVVGPFMGTIRSTTRVWDEPLASLVGLGGMLKMLQLLYLPDPDDHEYVTGYGGYFDAATNFAARGGLPLELWAPIARLLSFRMPQADGAALLGQVMVTIDEHLAAEAANSDADD
ncbi:MAG: hypothetical protein DRI90_06620 [Deltaproteobacteria bacterium]|nr:MAG: hypothetical protein DRI90_06620 [Deltaproteobacteria bacterium]